MSICEKQEKFVREFSEFGDAFDKMSYLIALSAKLPQPGPELLRSENLVRGCQSEVWVRAGVEDGAVFITAYSDTLTLRGILFILCRVFSDEKPGDAPSATPGFLDQCGVTVMLEAGRRNGVGKIHDMIKRQIFAANCGRVL